MKDLVKEVENKNLTNPEWLDSEKTAPELRKICKEIGYTYKEYGTAKKKDLIQMIVEKSTPKDNDKPKGKYQKVDREGTVSLKQVCEELKVSPRSARKLLRSSDLNRNSQWRWEKGSKELKEAQSLIKSKLVK